MTDTDILISGAGPTGLALALALAHRGVKPRIISRATGPGEQSRAAGVHARTLEFYRQFGFAERLVADGLPLERVVVRRSDGKGHVVEQLHATFENLGEGISPYPYLLGYPQDEHEKLLIEQLSALGLVPEYGTELTAFTDDGDGVTATLAGGETVRCAWLAGCDGAHSAVRHGTGIGFQGGTYDQLFYVADARTEGGFGNEIIATMGEHAVALMFPIDRNGRVRFIGLVPPDLGDHTDLTFEDIRADAEGLLGVRAAHIGWFSTYRVHHRVADSFRKGHAFLLGDAGHIHSPAGGQGMNTGIGDAMNLGWKLAMVVQGRAPATLLDSYEPERIAFARSLVKTTDRAFEPMIRGGIVGELMRRLVVPVVATVATSFAMTRHAAFRALSQVHIHYPDSVLSEGQAGGIEGGERLPWTGFAGEDNFAPLASLDWQVHAHGGVAPSVEQACDALKLSLHRFSFDDAARHAGFADGAVTLVRPDGYIALAAKGDAGDAVRHYAAARGLRFG